jgi:hypothetical protein
MDVAWEFKLIHLLLHRFDFYLQFKSIADFRGDNYETVSF